MKPLLTRAEARAFDAQASEVGGVCSLLLMENAGRGAAEAMARRFPDRLERVVCVGGPGQNGGDAWVLARHLRCAGHRPEVWLVGDEAKLRGDAKPNWESLRAIGVPRYVLTDARLPELERDLARASLVVDGLFGTGLDRPLAGRFREVVNALGRARAPKVALDLPSGVDADTGAVLGAACQASLTLSFGAAKPGLFQHPGAALAGEVEVLSLGVPAPVDCALQLLERSDLGRLLPVRAPDAHKGRAGHLLVVAGSPGKSG
ncbi:MAG: NAD(P)H-hydrate epimerase, partial [Deltaproteobacteria bacterium]|nr:NAD(P)H-hydrate epimerase [Deltaproteobacteria bacterium]